MARSAITFLVSLLFAIGYLLVTHSSVCFLDKQPSIKKNEIQHNLRAPGTESPEERKKHVEEIMTHVDPEYQEICRDMLEGKAVSMAQGWQDWMMYHNYFRDRKWGDGFYLDIGANHALKISNTLFFDKCLGWRGVCAEPQKQYHAEIRQKRSCELLPNCVMGHDATVTSSSTGVMFTLEETTTDADSAMRCTGIKTLQQRFDIQKIDFVSLDIEGAEPNVLRCWPFTEVETTMFVVETNKAADLRLVDLFFNRNGYVGADTFTNSVDGERYSWLDNLYVRDERERRIPPTGFTCTPTMRKYAGNWCVQRKDVYNDPQWFAKCE